MVGHPKPHLIDILSNILPEIQSGFLPDRLFEANKIRPWGKNYFGKRPQTVWWSGRTKYDNVVDNVVDDENDDDDDDGDEDENVADDDVKDDDVQEDEVEDDDVEENQGEDDNAEDGLEEKKVEDDDVEKEKDDDVEGDSIQGMTKKMIMGQGPTLCLLTKTSLGFHKSFSQGPVQNHTRIS